MTALNSSSGFVVTRPLGNGRPTHVANAGTERAVAIDPERQALDEAHRVYGIEMAQRQDARCLLAPGRACDQVIPSAVASRDTFHSCRQVAIACGDEVDELVDLIRPLRWRLDPNPTSDTLEDCRCSKRIAGRRLTPVNSPLIAHTRSG